MVRGILAFAALVLVMIDAFLVINGLVAIFDVQLRVSTRMTRTKMTMPALQNQLDHRADDRRHPMSG